MSRAKRARLLRWPEVGGHVWGFRARDEQPADVRVHLQDEDEPDRLHLLRLTPREAAVLSVCLRQAAARAGYRGGTAMTCHLLRALTPDQECGSTHVWDRDGTAWVTRCRREAGHPKAHMNLSSHFPDDMQWWDDPEQETAR